MTQIEIWLPPPITATEAAAIIGRLGGQATADRARERVRAVARTMCGEIGKEVPECWQ